MPWILNPSTRLQNSTFYIVWCEGRIVLSWLHPLHCRAKLLKGLIDQFPVFLFANKNHKASRAETSRQFVYFKSQYWNADCSWPHIDQSKQTQQHRKDNISHLLTYIYKKIQTKINNACELRSPNQPRVTYCILAIKSLRNGLCYLIITEKETSFSKLLIILFNLQILCK